MEITTFEIYCRFTTSCLLHDNMHNGHPEKAGGLDKFELGLTQKEQLQRYRAQYQSRVTFSGTNLHHYVTGHN